MYVYLASQSDFHWNPIQCQSCKMRGGRVREEGDYI